MGICQRRCHRRQHQSVSLFKPELLQMTEMLPCLVLTSRPRCRRREVRKLYIQAAPPGQASASRLLPITDQRDNIINMTFYMIDELLFY